MEKSRFLTKLFPAKSMKAARILLLCGLAVIASFVTRAVPAQPPPGPQKVHMVWMGGSDCPPCVAWRRDELPKLQSTPEFNAITFSYVTKVIRSSVPSGIFLPSEVRQYKEKLDHASSMRAGSPQAAILVNGEVFDYFHGTRSAEDIVQMLKAIKSGTNYPFDRCVKVAKTWRSCEIPG